MVLDVVDAAVEDLELDGVLQVASFHPNYQFADADPDDVENYSNRAPYPTLHLIREESLAAMGGELASGGRQQPNWPPSCSKPSRRSQSRRRR